MRENLWYLLGINILLALSNETLKGVGCGFPQALGYLVAKGHLNCFFERKLTILICWIRGLWQSTFWLNPVLEAKIYVKYIRIWVNWIDFWFFHSDGLCTLNSTWALWFFKCFKPSIETFHGPKIRTKWLFCPPIHISNLDFSCGLGPHSGPFVAIFLA